VLFFGKTQMKPTTLDEKFPTHGFYQDASLEDDEEPTVSKELEGLQQIHSHHQLEVLLFFYLTCIQTRRLKAADSAVYRAGADCRQMEAGHAMVVALYQLKADVPVIAARWATVCIPNI
ncbi:hypothetical protein CRENBAI_019489, partial [Crenichthys baileyi]